ncbi:hypothetical protein DHEL01_v203268 [Diaporthe helianthi]|uniref:Uncharacterized protein n=1 Tax=Diaporthe helianthi TaxID=158607 RepID=A0A2P5I754_DIAHE|nr:hypothetical protein DHEL01_v203268 [Diaporthe helianthi]
MPRIRGGVDSWYMTRGGVDSCYVSQCKGDRIAIVTFKLPPDASHTWQTGRHASSPGKGTSSAATGAGSTSPNNCGGSPGASDNGSPPQGPPSGPSNSSVLLKQPCSPSPLSKTWRTRQGKGGEGPQEDVARGRMERPRASVERGTNCVRIVPYGGAGSDVIPRHPFKGPMQRGQKGMHHQNGIA